ncbi:MOSC domain-containing protein YiiM [Cohaesibacter marisflavi]|uniref:MOSC domain-containing protein YiiM n=1 Tax=Cohaesibacter marisflavi TaxID=655353 RepID=A0A1I5IZ29_9HYPH|nr:MOSC domain-containing protein YiiM [Cohaesibacter marisflavi]
MSSLLFYVWLFLSPVLQSRERGSALIEKNFEGTVIAVSLDKAHAFSKKQKSAIRLLEGLGVEGDAHMGALVQHRSRVRANPNQPNLRQVHLMHQELFEEVAQKGFTVKPADMGENITTSGIDLLALPTGAVLHIGDEAEVEITGLRNPCSQIEAWQPGLLKELVYKDEAGDLVRKAGVMGIVRKGGMVKPDDRITVTLPDEPWRKLERV